MERGWHWLRGRSAVELAGLAAGLAVFGYVGWDSALWDPRLQLLLHLLAVGAILALAMAAVRGAELPRTRIDVPLLGLVACFALATVFALNVGMSLRAMGSIVAFALALPLALLAVRHRPTWVGLLASVPVLLFSDPDPGRSCCGVASSGSWWARPACRRCGWRARARRSDRWRCRRL